MRFYKYMAVSTDWREKKKRRIIIVPYLIAKFKCVELFRNSLHIPNAVGTAIFESLILV